MGVGVVPSTLWLVTRNEWIAEYRLLWWFRAWVMFGAAFGAGCLGIVFYDYCYRWMYPTPVAAGAGAGGGRARGGRRRRY